MVNHLCVAKECWVRRILSLLMVLRVFGLNYSSNFRRTMTDALGSAKVRFWRTIFAIVVCPVIPVFPVFLALKLGLFAVQSGPGKFFVAGVLILAVFAVPTAWILGTSIFLKYRRAENHRLKNYIIAGWVIGAILGSLFVFLFLLTMPFGVVLVWPLFLLFPYCTLVSLLIWMIASFGQGRQPGAIDDVGVRS